MSEKLPKEFIDWNEEELTHKKLVDDSKFNEVTNPSLKVCLYAVKRRPQNIKYINNPPFEVIKEALDWSANNLKYISPMTDEAFQYAFSVDVNALKFIPKPYSREVLIQAALKHKNFLMFYTEADIELIEMSMKKFGKGVLSYVDFETHEMQDHFIKSLNHSKLLDIKDPSEKVMLKLCSKYNYGSEDGDDEEGNAIIRKMIFDNPNTTMKVLSAFLEVVEPSYKDLVVSHVNFKVNA